MKKKLVLGVTGAMILVLASLWLIKTSQRPRCKQRGIKFAAQRAAGSLTPRAVAKCTCKHVRSARCLRENKLNERWQEWRIR